MKKTLYLWDMGGTIFSEKWNPKIAGYPTLIAYAAAQLKKNIKDVTGREIEDMHEIPFKEGKYFDLSLQPGYKEVLTWTKYNETFTTGVKEQFDWRAYYLNQKAGYDIRKYIDKVNSTFDYGETNKKTKAMLIEYLESKYDQGYHTVVYTDDNIKNCQFFTKAAQQLKKRYKDFSYRIYYILNDDRGIREKDGYWEIGSLFDIIKNEKKLII